MAGTEWYRIGTCQGIEMSCFGSRIRESLAAVAFLELIFQPNVPQADETQFT